MIHFVIVRQAKEFPMTFSKEKKKKTRKCLLFQSCFFFQDKTLVDFIYFVFTRIPFDSDHRRFRSQFCPLLYVWRQSSAINSPGLLFQSSLKPLLQCHATHCSRTAASAVVCCQRLTILQGKMGTVVETRNRQSSLCTTRPCPLCFEVSPLGGAGRGQGAQLWVGKTIGELICRSVFVLAPERAWWPCLVQVLSDTRVEIGLVISVEDVSTMDEEWKGVGEMLWACNYSVTENWNRLWVYTGIYTCSETIPYTCENWKLDEEQMNDSWKPDEA